MEPGLYIIIIYIEQAVVVVWIECDKFSKQAKIRRGAVALGEGCGFDFRSDELIIIFISWYMEYGHSTRNLSKNERKVGNWVQSYCLPATCGIQREAKKSVYIIFIAFFFSSKKHIVPSLLSICSIYTTSN